MRTRIRYILDASNMSDWQREHSQNERIVIHVLPGDLYVVLAGIYDWFTLEEGDQIMPMRSFKVRFPILRA